MSAIVRMPQLAAGGAEAAIQTWLVSVGDEVAVEQEIVEIETEKAVVEHESEVAGVLAQILVGDGESAAVGTPIAVLATDGESIEQAIADAGTQSAAAGSSAAAVSASVALPASDPAPVPVVDPVPATDSATARLFASPLVRRLAVEHGIDLTAVRGSGPRGRIVRRDIDDLVSRPTATKPAPAAAGAAPTAASAGYTDVPHTGMRRAIARRLVESKTTIPHFTLTADCRVDELIALRGRINETTGRRVSVNDFVLKAVAAALIEVPDANAIWTEDATRRFDGVDLAVAVSIPGGLLTPVLRGVERRSLGDIGDAVRDLAERARGGGLKQHELEGGSFSVSNLGMHGVTQFSAIINPPHSGILAVGAATRRPVVTDDGAVEAASMMTVTLSADHRVLDGALAAQWLAAFVRRIESPLSLLI